MGHFLWTTIKIYFILIAMLKGISVYSADAVWRNILRDLNATVLDAPTSVGINLDSLNISMPASALELKTALINASDNTKIIYKLFGTNVHLSNLHTLVIAQIYKSGGITATDLKKSLGYSADATTHTVESAIYQLRKMYGHDFIINENGVYKLGKL